MHALVKTAFNRLYALDPEEEERKLNDNGNDSQEGVEMNVTTDARVASTNPSGVESVPEGEDPESSEAQPANEPPPVPVAALEADLAPQSEGGETEGTRQKCKFARYFPGILDDILYSQMVCLPF